MTASTTTQTAPAVTAEQGCTFGHCTRPATHRSVIRYPAGPRHDAFDWPAYLCDEDLETERVSAEFTGATVEAEPLTVVPA